MLVFAKADVPRLKSLEIFGGHGCPDENDFGGDLDEFRCVSNDAEETCPGLAQWFLEDHVGRSDTILQTSKKNY